ncbi:MAG: type IV pilin protein [Oleiphilaceae bacterium]|nr:type IV pilin protein [Oleiphilaceae bacterium]
MKHRQRQQGFSLIELMIVVVIIGIIAAIAYPSYQRNIEQTRRTTAQSEMMELAQGLERYYTSNYTYVGASLRFNTSPRGTPSAEAFYDFALNSVSQNAYQISATPKNAQSSDRCGTLTLDQQGNRGAGDTDCW